MDSTTLSPEKVELSTLTRDEATGKMVYKARKTAIERQQRLECLLACVCSARDILG